MLEREMCNKPDLIIPVEKVASIIGGKSVLILGAAPSVESLTAEFMNGFDLIVRVNNYRIFNACERTDIFYSMLGGSIKKRCGDLAREGCKFIFVKSPAKDFIVKDEKGNKNIFKSLDIEGIFRQWRMGWIELPVYFQTIENWCWLADQIGQIPTTGLSAIVDIYRFKPAQMHIAGFDFFSSGMHNGYPLTIKPWPKHHDFKGEMLFLRDFVSKHKNISCDSIIQKIFSDPERFPKIGSKPD